MNEEIKEILNEKFEHLKSINEIKFLNDLNENDLQNKKKDFLEKTLSQSGNFVQKNDKKDFENYFNKEEENFEKECFQLKTVIQDNYITQNNKNNKIEELHKLYEEKVNKIIGYVKIGNNNKYLEELLKNNILTIENVEASNNLRMQKKMNKILEREVLRLRKDIKEGKVIDFDEEDEEDDDDLEGFEEDEEYSSVDDDFILGEMKEDSFKVKKNNFMKDKEDNFEVKKNNFFNDKDDLKKNEASSDSENNDRDEIIKNNFLKNKSVKSRKKILNEIIKSRKSKISNDSKFSSNSKKSRNSKISIYKNRQEIIVPKNDIFNSSKFSNERNPELLKKMMSVDMDKKNSLLSSRSVKLKNKLLKKNHLFNNKNNLSKNKSKSKNLKKKNYSEKNIFLKNEEKLFKEKKNVFFDNVKKVLEKRKFQTPKERVFKGFGYQNKLSKTQNSKSTNKIKKKRNSRKSFNNTNSSKIIYSHLFKKEKNFKKLISEKILKSSKEIYNKKKKDKSQKILKPVNFTSSKKILDKVIFERNLKRKEKINERENLEKNKILENNINKINLENKEKNNLKGNKFNIDNIVYNEKILDRKESLEKIENKYDFEKNQNQNILEKNIKRENKKIENENIFEKEEKKNIIKNGESKISLFLSKINNQKEFEAYTKKHKIINYRQTTKKYKNFDFNKIIYSNKEIMEELSFSDQFILDLLKNSKKDSISLIPPKSSFLMDYSKPSFIKNSKNNNVEEIEIAHNFFDLNKNLDVLSDKEFLDNKNKQIESKVFLENKIIESKVFLENKKNRDFLQDKIDKKFIEDKINKVFLEKNEKPAKIENIDLKKKMEKKKNNYIQKNKINFSKKGKDDKIFKIEKDEEISENNFFDNNFMVESILKR